MNGEEEPVKDVEVDDIPDNQSEASSIMSSRTEYHELPTRSTLINSSGLSSVGDGMFPLSDLSHHKTTGEWQFLATSSTVLFTNSSSFQELEKYPASRVVCQDH